MLNAILALLANQRFLNIVSCLIFWRISFTEPFAGKSLNRIYRGNGGRWWIVRVLCLLLFSVSRHDHLYERMENDNEIVNVWNWRVMICYLRLQDSYTLEVIVRVQASDLPIFHLLTTHPIFILSWSIYIQDIPHRMRRLIWVSTSLVALINFVILKWISKEDPRRETGGL